MSDLMHDRQPSGRCAPFPSSVLPGIREDEDNAGRRRAKARGAGHNARGHPMTTNTLFANAHGLSSEPASAYAWTVLRTLLMTAAVGAGFLALSVAAVSVRVLATSHAFPLWHEELTRLVPFLG